MEDGAGPTSAAQPQSRWDAPAWPARTDLYGSGRLHGAEGDVLPEGTGRLEPSGRHPGRASKAREGQIGAAAAFAPRLRLIAGAGPARPGTSPLVRPRRAPGEEGRAEHPRERPACIIVDVG